MSDNAQFRVRNRLQVDGRDVVIGSETVEVLLQDESGNVVIGRGTTVPTAGTAGYAKGAYFVDTDVATGLTGVYQNIGTTAACSFVAIGAATVEARTATADGTGTGQISAGTTHVTVTSDDANKIITLPAPVVGRQVVIHNGATGYELRSSAPATVAINAGVGASAESAIAANSTVLAICVTTTAWKAIFLDADGDVAKVEAAA